MTRSAARLLIAVATPLLFFAGAADARAAGPGPDPSKVEAMKKLAFLVGEWEGGGWIQMGPDARQSFQGRETVETRLAGTVLVIEGEHVSRVPGAEDPVVVHHALAVVSPASDGGYDFQSWLFNREGGSFKGHVEDGGFVWGMTTARGEIRYTIRLDHEGHWYEIGERADESGDWQRFFEMTLTKTD